MAVQCIASTVKVTSLLRPSVNDSCSVFEEEANSQSVYQPVSVNWLDMEAVESELGLRSRPVGGSAPSSPFSPLRPHLVVSRAPHAWLRQLATRTRLYLAPTHMDNIPEAHCTDVFVQVFPKRNEKVLPLPKSKLTNDRIDLPMSFSQLLFYISNTNQRYLWKEAYKRYVAQYSNNSSKEDSIINVLDYNVILVEVILRIYGCKIIKIKTDPSDPNLKTTEVVTGKYASRIYETQCNLSPVLCAIETELNIFLIHNSASKNNLTECMTFSPALLECNYGRRLFIIYQLLHIMKSMYNRGLYLGEIGLDDIYLTENLWIQVIPHLTFNISVVNPKDLHEVSKSVTSTSTDHYSKYVKKGYKTTNETEEVTKSLTRDELVSLEKLCDLWMKGCLSTLDYLLHLNALAGRSIGEPSSHPIVPWVTNFSSRCGKEWRDLTKSKFRLNKGDKQLDMTYDVHGKDFSASSSTPQIPHHVSDVLSDITYYVYMARRTPKNVLCQNVRNNWVPAEYPSSIQRMQEWTPDECIPEFFTDPTVFRSIHEDLPDLQVPAWATCIEDFIAKHREALESIQVSESVHHWIDLTFGYKLSGSAAIKAKNVCLSLVDGHTNLNKSGPVQLFTSPHPARFPYSDGWGEKLPPRLVWYKEKKIVFKVNDFPPDCGDPDVGDIPQNYSNLITQSNQKHSESHLQRNKSSSVTRKANKETTTSESVLSPLKLNSDAKINSPHQRRYKVQQSEFGKNIIHLPKEYNPLSQLMAFEHLHNFKVKTFYSSSSANSGAKTKKSVLKTSEASNDVLETDLLRRYPDIPSDSNSFTNQMFVESYEQNYLKRHGKTDVKEPYIKEKKDRNFNIRQVTSTSLFKEVSSVNRKRDMQVLGCLIVELFLYHKVRPLSLVATQNFNERYKVCRLVLKKNMNLLPKCVKYVACLLLRINETNFRETFKTVEDVIEQNLDLNPSDVNYPCISQTGLPCCSTLQLLQPLLANQLLPFPDHFSSLYSIIRVLYEYSMAEREAEILYSFECNGRDCSKYQTLDKTKCYFIRKIAESKVRACSLQLEELLNQITSYNQFDSVDILLPHFIEMLQNRDTCILSAWYLFDTFSRALGPIDTSNKLLKLILRLYDERILDRNFTTSNSEIGQNITVYSNIKSVKLYHNIFLLQLIIRFGLQSFLDNFIPHLVEAVGGYKDVVYKDSVMHTHAIGFDTKPHDLIKKLSYREDSLKVASNIPQDIISPDTSCGSENVLTPVEKDSSIRVEKTKPPGIESNVDTELFHFESEGNKEVGEVDGINNSDVVGFNKSKIKHLLEEIDKECRIPSLEMYTEDNQTTEIGAVEIITTEAENQSEYREGASNYFSLKKEFDNKVSEPSLNLPPAPGTFRSYVREIEKDENPEAQSTPIRSKKSSVSESILANMEVGRTQDYNISEMTSVSLIWLSHRLGPVLTSKYVTRNLLKMLTLCYVGRENLSPQTEMKQQKDLDSLCITNGHLVGDCNAAKVINCLTSIADLYGEQLILLQYFPHMGDLIASAKKRMTRSLEGGVISCFQFLRCLIPFLSDVKLMEQLQDIILKNILHPTIRLLSSTRTLFPSGQIARIALAKKFLETLYVIALRIGPEMTRKHLCVPALQKFCLVFDRVHCPSREWRESDAESVNAEASTSKEPVQEIPDFVVPSERILNTATEDGIPFLEIRRDGSTAEWRVRDGVITGGSESGAVISSSPSQQPPEATDTALEEIKAAFTAELAHQICTAFVEFVGKTTMFRSLTNFATVFELNEKFLAESSDEDIFQPTSTSFPREENVNEAASADPTAASNVSTSESIPFQRVTNTEETSNANSFGSNVAVIGNRIDVQADPNDESTNRVGSNYTNALDIVSYKVSRSSNSSRHLRGDWLMYWEHEIGRPDKENQFNLKQIKLQTFSGHTHSVRHIVCLDNENSFMTSSKDKTVKLWSLRNKGDGSSVSFCQWTYSGHRKGILSLTFLESLRLTISTDGAVHIWDPYVETTIAQLDSSKTTPASIVKAMPAPSTLILSATTDTLLKVIDARTLNYSHELKVCSNPSTFIRCICVSPSGKWVAVGLATGHLSLIDIRTGVLISHWKAHDGEVLQLVTVNEKIIVSSSLDQTVLAWSTIDGKLKFQLKGSTEPVHCLAMYYSELISGTTNNRIGVHTAVEQDANFSSTKLRSDTFRGVLTSLAVLPLNRMLLLGGEGGNVSLLC